MINTNNFKKLWFLLRPGRENNCLLHLDLNPGSVHNRRPHLHVPCDQLQPEREILQVLLRPGEEGR